MGNLGVLKEERKAGLQDFASPNGVIEAQLEQRPPLPERCVVEDLVVSALRGARNAPRGQSCHPLRASALRDQRIEESLDQSLGGGSLLVCGKASIAREIGTSDFGAKSTPMPTMQKCDAKPAIRCRENRRARHVRVIAALAH